MLIQKNTFKAKIQYHICKTGLHKDSVSCQLFITTYLTYYDKCNMVW